MRKNLKVFKETHLCLFGLYLVINFALWISEQAHLKIFGEALTMICFFRSQLYSI